MSQFYEHWNIVPPSAWHWPHFTAREMACRRTGGLLLVPALMDKLEVLRVEVNFPLPVTSGYRDPDYNAEISSTGRAGPHTTGRAADIAVSGENAYTLLCCAINARCFTGIGLNQRGPYSGRFIHLDTLPLSSAPRPRVWTYG